WMELERRLTPGRLSKVDASAAVDQLVLRLQGGNGGVFYATDQFFRAAERAQAVSGAQYLALAKMLVGETPMVHLPPAAQAARSSYYTVRCAQPWQRFVEAERLVVAVRDISLLPDSATAAAP